MSARIAGVISNGPPQAARELLSSMVGSMLQERFDSYGTLFVAELGCHIGWVAEGRAAADANPSVSQEGHRIVVFAGEHFGERLGKSPAATLLSMWDEKGDSALRELNGWFAGVCIDVRKRTVLLFNDRFGLHRIYLSRTDDTLTFASEAKAILAVRPETRRLRPRALAEFVAFGSVQNNRTLFHDIDLLPGGSAWTINAPADIQEARYFTPDEWERQALLSDDDFYESLNATMSAAVRRHFGESGDAGVSLTGGVDTRVIMAFADQVAGKRASYTFGGMYRDCYDVRIAGEVARTCGFEHEVLRLGPTFLRNFSEHAEKTVWLTDGTLDVGATHEVYLNGLARTIAPVRITGNYGSEVFRSASYFKPTRVSTDLFTADFVPYIQEARESFAGLKSGHPVSIAAFREIPWHLSGRLNAAQSQLTVRSPYTDNDLVALAYRAPAHVRENTGLWNRLVLERNAALGAIPTDRGHVATVPALRTLPSRLYNHLLFKAEWYNEAGMPHWLSRVERLVPGSMRPLPFVGTHKIEQYRAWFRSELYEPLYSILNATSGKTPYVDSRRALGLLAAHRDGAANYLTEIQRLASIALIQKLFIADIRPVRSIPVEQPPLAQYSNAGGR